VAGFLLAVALWLGCWSPQLIPEPGVESDAYRQWQEERQQNLLREDGWLTLVGLYWLDAGENTFGSSPDKDAVFPAGQMPPQAGIFRVDSAGVVVEVRDGVPILYQGQPVSALVLSSDLTGNPTILELGSLSFFLIERGGAKAIRLRDGDNASRGEFEGLDYFPFDRSWRIPAELRPHETTMGLDIPTVMGTTHRMSSPGTLMFEIDGKSYSLDAIGEPEDEEYFIVFGDQTNRKESYGGGRFVYAAAPDNEGKTVLDFNRAHNPPCAFTPFATCPLPPRRTYYQYE
jgi:uncharacterized protein (DUF1684 family)